MDNKTLILSAVGIVILFRVSRFIHYRATFKMNLPRELCILVFTIYLSYVASITMNLTGIFRGLFHFTWFKNCIPLYGIIEILRHGDLLVITRNILGNIILFIPFGLIAPLLSRSNRYLFRIASVSFGFSFIIELTQGLTWRGGDVDDILLNTAGGVIGYCIYIFMQRRSRSIKYNFLATNDIDYVNR